MEERVLKDLFKIYISCIDSYNSKILQTINDKYTIIDKSMLATYIYVKILEDREERNTLVTEVLRNYLLRQIIYGETGNLALEITNKSRLNLYNKVINELITEKFETKNKVLQELKYNYNVIERNEYTELLDFCEYIAEIAILEKLSKRGNEEAKKCIETRSIALQNLTIESNDKFKTEKDFILTAIRENRFEETQYYHLLEVALNLKDVYRYSTFITIIPENVLFHQYVIAVTGIILSEYLVSKLNEEIDIYTIIIKSLLHDFPEYTGNEIVTQVKNYNEDTIAMFKEIEIADEEGLKAKIGNNLYNIILNYADGAEGYVSELLDKLIAIMKLWVEVRYMGNRIYIRSICSIFQSRFKRFKKVEKIDKLKCKEFYLELVRICYIYIKENLTEYDPEMTLNYFTPEEIQEIREEISEIKRDKNLFLK